MPPKKRNSHLKTVRLSKKLKNENYQNTFPYEEPFDLEPEIDDDNWYSKAFNSAIEESVFLSLRIW